MKVVQVTPARFHHFDLARQLEKRGCLEVIYSGYPRWKLRQHKEGGVPDRRIRTFPWVEGAYMAYSRYLGTRHALRHFRSAFAYAVLATLDSYAARTLPECDVLIAQSGCGLHSGERARERGAIYVCDRGSSHIRFQSEILKAEHAKWGQIYDAISDRLIAREEAEYERADLVTVPSEFAYQSFVAKGVPAHKLRKVSYGVDLSRFKPSGTPDPEVFHVLYVGGLTLRKGVPYLLSAFQQLKHPRKKLTLVGAMGADMRLFLAQRPLPERVEWVGHVPQASLSRYMSTAQVMVLPSLEEGLALVQAQALACGCPVIGTFNTGASDIFSHGVEGFILPAGDAGLLAEAMQQIADDPALQRSMSANALLRVSAIGGWDKYGETMTRVLNDAFKPVGATFDPKLVATTRP